MKIIFQRKIDFITFQLKLQFYDLSENELKLLALLYVADLDTAKETALKMNVFKSRQSIDNHISKFRKLGIIKEDKIELYYPIETKDKETFIDLELCIQSSKPFQKE